MKCLAPRGAWLRLGAPLFICPWGLASALSRARPRLRMLPDHVESRDRKANAQIQRFGACPDPKKSEQLFWDLPWRRNYSEPCPTAIQKIVGSLSAVLPVAGLFWRDQLDARFVVEGLAMRLTLATWNINSVRLRIDLVARFFREQAPHVLRLACRRQKCRDSGVPASLLSHKLARLSICRDQRPERLIMGLR